MKKLLLLAFLAIGLTASAYIRGAFGGEKTINAAVRGERVDANMIDSCLHHFSWQCQHYVDQNSQTLTLWANTLDELDYMVNYFSGYGYGFGCVESVDRGFKSVGVLTYDDEHRGAFAIMSEAVEPFGFAPVGYFVKAGI